MQGRLDVDGIINQLINSGGRNVKIKEKDVSLLCKIAREIFMEQPVFLELEAPIKICGKFHQTISLASGNTIGKQKLSSTDCDLKYARRHIFTWITAFFYESVFLMLLIYLLL